MTNGPLERLNQLYHNNRIHQIPNSFPPKHPINYVQTKNLKPLYQVSLDILEKKEKCSNKFNANHFHALNYFQTRKTPLFMNGELMFNEIIKNFIRFEDYILTSINYK